MIAWLKPFLLTITLIVACAHAWAGEGELTPQHALGSTAAQCPKLFVPTYNLRTLFANPLLRARAIRFFRDGVWALSPEAGSQAFIDLITRLATQDTVIPDQAIYSALRDLIANRASDFKPSFSQDDDLRVLTRAKQLAELVGDETPESVIDIGAGNGRIASAMRSLWKLAAAKTYALDVADYREASDVSWLTYENGKIPLAGESIELATLLMVLHHVPNPSGILAEAFRVLKPGGRLIVRETNASDADEILFNQVLDTMFYQVFSPNEQVPLPESYRSKPQWLEQFRQAGFMLEKVVENEPNNPFSPVQFVLRKPVARTETAFERPQLLRDAIKAGTAIALPPELATNIDYYVFPTKYCPVGCNHCYFGSPKPNGRTKYDPFVLSGDAITKFTELVRHTQARSLTITGGGDPLLEPAKTAQIIQHGEASAITIHTSAFWAKTLPATERIVLRLFEAYQNNPKAALFRFRLSVDQYHTVPAAYLANVIRVFRANREKFDASKFKLIFHSIYNDPRIIDIGNWLKAANPSEFTLEYDTALRADHPKAIHFKDGLTIEIDYSPLMPADPLPNMLDPEKVEKSVAQFDEGRNPRPAVTHFKGEEKVCACVYEEGSVELWNSGAADSISSIYEHSPEQIMKAFADIIYSASIRNGALYVENIINEVNPLAVKRAKATASATFFMKTALTESKTRLYVTIRIVQDYLREGKLTDVDIAKLPHDAQELILMPKSELQDLYQRSRHTIVDDALEDPHVSVGSLEKLYGKILLGQYDVTGNDMLQTVATSQKIPANMKDIFLKRVLPLTSLGKRKPNP